MIWRFVIELPAGGSWSSAFCIRSMTRLHTHPLRLEHLSLIYTDFFSVLFEFFDLWFCWSVSESLVHVTHRVHILSWLDFHSSINAIGYSAAVFVHFISLFFICFYCCEYDKATTLSCAISLSVIDPKRVFPFFCSSADCIDFGRRWEKVPVRTSWLALGKHPHQANDREVHGVPLRGQNREAVDAWCQGHHHWLLFESHGVWRRCTVWQLGTRRGAVSSDWRLSIWYLSIDARSPRVSFPIKVALELSFLNHFEFFSRNDFERYEPYTNLLWLHYIVDKLINGARYRYSKTKKHRAAVNEMMQERDELLNFTSASDYVTSLEF